MIDPDGTSWRSSTPAMMASAITPAPTTLRVDSRSGLTGAFYGLLDEQPRSG